MALLEILKYPDPLLKMRSKEIERIDNEIKKLIHDMTETMYHANGIGLAACQVGISQRIIVIDVSPIDPEQNLLVLVNPEIISEEGEIEYEEGCLSVPDCVEKVKRKGTVHVKGISPEGREIEVVGGGICAVVLQHEIDHLNGTLILDRVSRLKREIYRKKLKKENR